MAQDSMFRDERDVNAVVYDTLGNVVGAEDISIANRPGWRSGTQPPASASYRAKS
jgi:hypothetical protein